MRRLVPALLIALALSACSDDTTPGVSPPSTSPPAPTQSTPASTTATVNVASSSLGNILVDAEGRTLYLFMKDTPTTSNCTGGCATTWPSLVATGAPTGGEGVDASKLGTINRSDGGTQVTYNQHPLYHFSGDSAAGDTNGQGVGGNWFVVSPAGEAIQS